MKQRHWIFDPYARKVRFSRWRSVVYYRWYGLREQLGIPAKDPTARYVPPASASVVEVPEIPRGESQTVGPGRGWWGWWEWKK
jgi:hypothetical protein